MGPLNSPPLGPSVLVSTSLSRHTVSCPLSSVLSLLVSTPPRVHSLSGLNLLVGTLPRVHPPSRPNVLAGTPPHVYPLRCSTSLLAHCLVSTPFGPNILAGTPPYIHPLWGPTSLLAHCLVSTLSGAQPPRWHTPHVHPHSGLNLLAGTPPRVCPPSGPSVLADTPPRVHPLQCSASLLAHRLVSTPYEAQRLCWHTASCLPPSVFNLLVGTRLMSTPL